MNASVRIECDVLSLGNVALSYQVYGRDSERRKPPLVLLHGYSIRSTGPTYQALFDALASEFVVYALDLRGHGGSFACIEDWTFAQVAEDIRRAVRALGLTNPLHVGHSFGGFIGLVTELHHPGTFGALCLMAPSAASGGSATPEIVKSTITNDGRNQPVVRELLRQMYVREVSNEAIQPLVEAMGTVDPVVHRAYFYDQYPSVVITDRLSEIRTPTLHLLGAHDNVVAPEEQHRTARGLPVSKEIIFSDEGHMLPLEAPERTAREIVNFWRNDLGLRE